MSDAPPAEGSADKPYVENPYTALLKEVHWTGVVPPGVNIVWQATPVIAGGFGNFFETGTTSMAVSTVNLPMLSPATLEIRSGLDNPTRETVFGEFPDGTGRVQGQYFLSLVPLILVLTGSVFYVTNNGTAPYGGAASVSISTSIRLHPLHLGGYDWHATAFCGAVSATISGTAPSEGTIGLTATMIINPPSVSISG